MPPETDLALGLICLSLLCAPIVAVGLFVALRRRRPQAWRRVAIACAGIVAITALAAFLQLRLALNLANVAVLAATYLAYCLLAAHGCLVRPLAARAVVLIAACAPIALGYLASTIGLMFLLLMAQDYVSPPDFSQAIAPGLVCERTQWGSAFSDEGYTVHLYGFLPAAPFVWRGLNSISVDATEPGTGPTSVACADVLAAYREDISGV